MSSACIDHGCKGFGLGYATAWVVKDGIRFTTTKHRKLYYEATGDWPECVRHKCDNPRCINVDHLEGGSFKDNMKDCRDRGRTYCKPLLGEYSPSAKLTDADCQYIRDNYRKHSKEFGLPALARRFGVGTSQVYRITRGEQRADPTPSEKPTKRLRSDAGPQAGHAVSTVPRPPGLEY